MYIYLFNFPLTEYIILNSMFEMQVIQDNV